MKPDKEEVLAEDVSHLLGWLTQEPILFSRMQQWLHPPIGEIGATEEERELLEKRISTLTRRLGAQPDFWYRLKGDESVEVYDEYGASALHEMISCYWRCRRSLLRSHLLFTGTSFFLEHKDIWKEQPSEEERQGMVELFTDRMWEEIEISYIRQASYWDRVAQLFDFMFFNIRHFDRDGFSGVIDRIRTNYASVLPQLADNDSWRKMNEFYISEKTDGYKWLVRRRNLLVHSLHLRPASEQVENPLFTFAFNHLEEKVRNKLRPGDALSEITVLHSQFRAMSVLFADVLSLCELALESGLHLSIHKTKDS